MAANYWDSGVRNFGHVGDDEEEWAPHNRAEPAGVAGSTFQFGHEEELARQQEIEEAEEREHEQDRELQERVAFNIEQEQLRGLVASGRVRFLDVDEHIRRKQERQSREGQEQEGGGSR